MILESSVRDNRGKYISTFKKATYLGVDQFIGLKNTKWTYKSGLLLLSMLSIKGKPEGVPVSIKVEYKNGKFSCQRPVMRI